MRQGKKRKMDLSSGIYAAGIWTVKITGAMIFLGLSWYAFRYTQYMNPRGSETPVNVHDSMTKNILFLLVTVLVLVGLFVLEQRLKPSVQAWMKRISLAAVSVWIGVLGLWWITAMDRQPVGDQAFIYGGASYFMEGQFFFLNTGGYCEVYPHQLGLIFLVEILFRFAGAYNYFAYQLLCVLLAVGIVMLGYVLVREITEHMTVAVAYCLLMALCLPLVFYTGWVYGEIPSIFFSMLTAICLLRYHRTGRKLWLAGMVCSAAVAVLVRKNSLIMLIALCLVAAVYALKQKDKRILAALLAAVLLPTAAYQGIYKMYELRSGYPHTGGIPAISFVAMGMQEENGKFGWYNNYCKDTYYAAECDRNLTALIAKRDIKSRLEMFRNDRAYMKVFYREKILSQWNQPLYQSVYFSAQYPEGVSPEPGSLVDRLETQDLLTVLAVCDRTQFILYVGMLCYFLFGVKKDSNILQHMLAVAMIGGFLFSVIWEAKARYIFPYYVTMYPLAAVGYWQALTFIGNLLGKRQKQQGDSNIIPFERAA